MTKSSGGSTLQYSPDGYWCWDGTQWLPLPTQMKTRYFIGGIHGSTLALVAPMHGNRTIVPLQLLAGATYEVERIEITTRVWIVLIGPGSQLGRVFATGDFRDSIEVRAAQIVDWVNAIARQQRG